MLRCSCFIEADSTFLLGGSVCTGSVGQRLPGANADEEECTSPVQSYRVSEISSVCIVPWAYKSERSATLQLTQSLWSECAADS